MGVVLIHVDAGGRVDGLARARSSRGAQPEERERPARARGGRVSVGGGDGGCGPGRGELRSDHARKPRASSLQCNGALPGKRGGKDPSRGRGRRTSARGTGLRDGRAHRARREDGVERVDVALAGLASMDAARSGPLPGLRGETWRVKFSRDWVRRELQRGCASAREMRDEQDAWYRYRRRATVCDWSISRNSPGINFPDFSPHGTLTDEDSNC